MFVPGCGFGFRPFGIHYYSCIRLFAGLVALFAIISNAQAGLHTDNSLRKFNEGFQAQRHVLIPPPDARLNHAFIVPVQDKHVEGSHGAFIPVQLAQANFEFTGYGKRRRYRAPRVRRRRLLPCMAVP